MKKDFQQLSSQATTMPYGEHHSVVSNVTDQTKFIYPSHIGSLNSLCLG
jgi:hypothetical protein